MKSVKKYLFRREILGGPRRPFISVVLSLSGKKVFKSTTRTVDEKIYTFFFNIEKEFYYKGRINKEG